MTFENIASILAVVCVLLGEVNKGEVAGVILLLCVLHICLVVPVKRLKEG